MKNAESWVKLIYKEGKMASFRGEISNLSFLGSNAQRHALATGEPLTGQAALMDTMKDLIVDVIGAFAITVIGYVSLKHKKGWLDRFHVSKKET